ncbi:hypothetical protein KKG24_05170 [Patescibacteria group bacterium]|nr:hypothetical protein [Patescibacteria group bacterium]
MSEISDGMESLCEDIAASREARRKDIKDLRGEAKNIRDNARKFAGKCRKLHKEMAKDLRSDLLTHREELINNVTSLREDFRKKEKEIRSDLTEAQRIWNEMNKTLKTRKKREVK